MLQLDLFEQATIEAVKEKVKALAMEGDDLRCPVCNQEMRAKHPRARAAALSSSQRPSRSFAYPAASRFLRQAGSARPAAW